MIKEKLRNGIQKTEDRVGQNQVEQEFIVYLFLILSSTESGVRIPKNIPSLGCTMDLNFFTTWFQHPNRTYNRSRSVHFASSSKTNIYANRYNDTTTRLGSRFASLFFRQWKGSIVKLIFPEFFAYLIAFLIIDLGRERERINCLNIGET